MSRYRLTRAAMGLCLLWGPGLAEAATNYVAIHLGETRDGLSWETAYTNIQDALNAETNANEIRVAGGVYGIGSPLSVTNPSVTIRGGYEGVGPGPGLHDPAQWPTVLKRGGTANRIASLGGAHDARLEHLTFTGGNVNLGAGLSILNSQGVLLLGCTVTNNAYSINSGGNHRGGGLYAVGSAVTLSNCLIRLNTVNNTHDGGPVTQGGGIYSDGTLRVFDTVIAANHAGHVVAGRTQGAGLYFNGTVLELKNVLLKENTVSLRDNGGGLYVAGGSASLLNCTVADHAGAGLVRAGGTVGLTNCIVWGNWTSLVGVVSAAHSDIGDQDLGGSAISADPLFEYGYYLAAGSPCAGGGSATATELGLAEYARNSAGDAYGPADPVNMGYHERTGFDAAHPDLYVAETGHDDDNDGAGPATPFRTLTKALATAHAGSRIHVAAGVYTNGAERFPLRLVDLPAVTILGVSASNTVINARGGNARVFQITRSQGAVLRNLTLTGGGNETYAANVNNGAGVQVDNSQRVLFDACTVSNNGYTGKDSAVNGGGLYGSISSEVTLSNCLVAGNRVRQGHDVSSYSANGAGVWSAGRLTLRETRVVSNAAVDSKANVALDTTRGGGLYFAGGNLRIRSTLVAGNTKSHADGGGGLCLLSGAADLANVTVVDNADQGIRRYGGTATVVNAILWGNGVDSTGTVTLLYACVSNAAGHIDGGHVISLDPAFVGGGDYRLRRVSPGVNQGLELAWMEGALDLDGFPRIRGVRPDLGAFESEWTSPRGVMLIVR